MATRHKFIQVAKELQGINALVENDLIAVLCGKNSILLSILEDWLRDAFKGVGYEVVRKDVSKGKPEDLILDLQQTGLFQEKKITFLHGVVANKKFLDAFVNAKLANPCLVFLGQSSAPKRLSNKPFHPIPFSDLGQQDLRAFIQFLSAHARIKLAEDAIRYLVEWIGGDAAGLRNEINKLALIFLNNEKSPTLTLSDIEPHCTALKSDKAFEISNLALKRESLKLKTVIEDLLKRGEHPLILLSLIQRFIRQCIELKANPSQSSLPDWLKRDYLNFIKKISSQKLAKAIQECQKIDQACKSGRIQNREVEILFSPFSHLLN